MNQGEWVRDGVFQNSGSRLAGSLFNTAMPNMQQPRSVRLAVDKTSNRLDVWLVLDEELKFSVKVECKNHWFEIVYELENVYLGDGVDLISNRETSRLTKAVDGSLIVSFFSEGKYKTFPLQSTDFKAHAWLRHREK